MLNIETICKGVLVYVWKLIRRKAFRRISGSPLTIGPICIYEEIPFKCNYFHEYDHFPKNCLKEDPTQDPREAPTQDPREARE